MMFLRERYYVIVLNCIVLSVLFFSNVVIDKEVLFLFVSYIVM